MHLVSMCFQLLVSGDDHSGYEAVAGQRTNAVFSTDSSPLSERRMSALSDRGFVLMLQKKPEREGVRDEQQRHDQRGNEVSRAQLPRREAGGIRLVEGVHEIDGAPNVENPRHE